MIGETFGNYTVTAKIREGGMGAVYLAEHPSIGRKVAIKILKPEYSNDPEARQRFQREASSTAQMRHPALVDVIDYGFHEKTGNAYIVMEYLEGDTLDARITQLGKMTPAVACTITRHIAVGVGVAHKRGVIHRDLKPANIFLIPDPSHPDVELIKILDFGIAKLFDRDGPSSSSTRSGTVIGTPMYMAPEQCRGGGPIDLRADIYSLGCILYEMLCGRPPFPYTFPGELIAAHLNQMPTPPRAIDPTLPEALERVVWRALAKDPDQRQQTMQEFERALAQALTDEISVPPVATMHSSRPPAARMSSTPPASISAIPAPQSTVQVDLPPGGFPVFPAAVHATPRPAAGSGSNAPRAAGSSESSAPRPGGSDTTMKRAASEVAKRRSLAPPRGARALVVVGTLLTVGGAVAIAALLSRSSVVQSFTDSVSRTDTAVLAQNPQPAARPDELAKPASPPMPLAASASPPPAEAPTGVLEPVALPPASAAPPVEAPIVSAAPPIAAPPPPAPAASIVIGIRNARAGLSVLVDGRPMSVPIRLPRDEQLHTIIFTTPNFKQETRSVRADQDQTLVLQNRPGLYVP